MTGRLTEWQRDEVARLRAEARHFRDLARHHSAAIVSLRRLPIGQRRPLEVLKSQCRIAEYRQAARQRDAAVAAIREGRA